MDAKLRTNVLVLNKSNEYVFNKVKEKYQNDEVFREAKKEKNRLYQQKLRETKKLYEALLIQSAVAQ